MLRRVLAILIMLVGVRVALASAQSNEGVRILNSKRYLNEVHADLKRTYYDPTFKGLNPDSLKVVAEEQLKAAKSDQERFRAIERFLEPFSDSHTYFVAPRRISLSDYHMRIQFVAETPYIMGVDLGSSAETAGLRVGDQIALFDGKPLTRATYYQTVREFLGAHPIRPLALKLKGVDGGLSDVVVHADTAEIYRMGGARFRKLISATRDSAEFATSHVQATIADSIFVWRLPQFAYADKGIGKVVERARKHAVVILDLRGNGGGAIKTLADLTGYFIDRELVVADVRARFGNEKYVAKPKKNGVTGRLMILVDSETGSAAEMFARLMQIEKRAIVYGDQTAGAVMTSLFYQYDDDVGSSITISDVVMPTGERLEGVGVTPDVPLIMSATHVASKTDPVLSYALLKAGARVPPAAAVRILNQ